MNEDEEPSWPAVQSDIELLVQVAKQLIGDGRRAMVSGGPVPPLRYRFLSAVGAATRELGPARQPITASGSLALPRMVFVSDGDVVTATESTAVVVLDSHRGPITLIDGRKAVRVLVWLVAVLVPLLATDLPPELQARLGWALATFAFAYEVDRSLAGKRK
jgi:hypothetical protein